MLGAKVWMEILESGINTDKYVCFKLMITI